MDIRALECFVVLAEDLHFRRAAHRLNMTQPTLTARIQVLERRVGVSLLIRDRRQVCLTESGRVFLEHARTTLGSARAAVSGALRAAKGEVGRLRFGFTGLTSYAGMPEMVRRFRQALPEVKIELVHAETLRLEAALLAEEIDIALLHPPLATPGLSQADLMPEKLVLAIPEAISSLARLKAIPIKALAGQPFLIGPRQTAPHLHDEIMSTFRAAGIVPNIVQEVGAMTTLIGLAAAGVGCGFVMSSLQVIQRAGLVYRPLSGATPPMISTALAWRTNALSPTATRFLDLAMPSRRQKANSATEGRRAAPTRRRDVRKDKLRLS